MRTRDQSNSELLLQSRSLKYQAGDSCLSQCRARCLAWHRDSLAPQRRDPADADRQHSACRACRVEFQRQLNHRRDRSGCRLPMPSLCRQLRRCSRCGCRSPGCRLALRSRRTPRSPAATSWSQVLIRVVLHEVVKENLTPMPPSAGHFETSVWIRNASAHPQRQPADGKHEQTMRFVAGAGRGIGFHTARLLAVMGADVYITDLSAATIAAAVSDSAALGTR